MTTECDLLIVGAGILGSSLAVALSSFSMRVVIVESAALLVDRMASPDERPLALSYSSMRAFESWGIWQDVASYAQPLSGVHVSRQGRFCKLRISAQEVGLPVLGYVLPAWHLLSALHRQVLGRVQSSLHASIRLYTSVRLQALMRTSSGWSAELVTSRGQRRLRARWVVGADGVRSCVKQLLNIKTEVFNYAEEALVTTARVEGGGHNQQIAYERFGNKEILAVLPLQANKVGIVWTLPTSLSQALFHMDEASFLARLQKAFGYKIGRFVQLGARQLYPLARSFTRQPLPPNLVLLGNASYTLHPIAAQGLNFSLQELMTLVAVLTDTTTRSFSLGCELFSNYFHFCIPRFRRMMAFTETVKGLFYDTQGYWALLFSQAGLLALDIMPGLKRYLIRELMGLGNSTLFGPPSKENLGEFLCPVMNK